MSKKWRYVGLIYLICGIATEAVLAYATYDNGALHRQHSPRDLLIGAAQYLAIVASWPYIVAVLLLMYFSVLPK
jgi:hypothetical protein